LPVLSRYLETLVSHSTYKYIIFYGTNEGYNEFLYIRKQSFTPTTSFKSCFRIMCVFLFLLYIILETYIHVFIKGDGGFSIEKNI
jgi:hypothetical protein